VRKELFEAQIETTLQSVIANNALISGGKNDTAVVTALLCAEVLSLIEDQLCLVFNLRCRGTIFIEF
jgi:hypothetical protein